VLFFELLFFSIALAVFTFAIRMPFWLVDCGDEATTWWIINRHKDLNRIDYEVPDSLIDGPHAYPPLQYFLISRFPKKYWALIGNVSNIAYDSIAVVLAYLITTWSSKAMGYENFRQIGLWTAALYACAPLLLPVNARVSGIKAQTQGSLLSFCYFLSLAAAFIHGAWPFYLVAVVIVILIVLASAFSLQNIAFVSLLLSVWYLSVIPIAVFAAGIAIGVLIPTIGVWKILVFKVNHSIFVHRNRPSMVFGLDKANSWKDFFNLPRTLLRNPLEFLHVSLHRNSYASSILNIPVFFILTFWLCTNTELRTSLLAGDDSRFSIMMVLSGFVLFVLMSQKLLVSLGPGDRYLGEYSYPFIAFLAVICATRLGVHETVLPALLMFQLTMVAVVVTFLNRKTVFPSLKEAFATESDVGVAEYLRSHGKPQNILAIPLKMSCVLSVNVNDAQTRFYHQWISQGDVGFAYHDENSESYNWPKPDYEFFAEKYGIDTVVVKHVAISNEKIQKLENTNTWPCVYENEDFKVYRKSISSV